jgi:lactoylglutathione lyase
MTITDLNHVAVHVRDLEASKRFYGEVLELKPKKRPDFDFEGAWYQLGPTRALHLLAGREADVVSHPRGAHFAFEVPDIQEARQQLLAKGVEIDRGPQERPDGAWQIFLLDPDGYWVELSDVSGLGK